MSMSVFQEKLKMSVNASNSLLCVGLDPDPNRMPIKNVFEFCVGLVDGTAEYSGAFKPNLGFFEALGIDGLTTLKRIVEYIHERYPGKLVIGDGKRGDIDSTSSRYATALFEFWDFDAVTVNAYGGRDSIQPFLNYEDRGVFVWCKSSNPDGGQFQGKRSQPGAELALFERMAEMSTGWNENGNLGLVVGATYPAELEKVRELAPSIPILVPGVGSQQGDLARSLRAGMENGFANILISSSRSINYASVEAKNFSQAAGKAAKTLRDEINAVLSDISHH